MEGAALIGLDTNILLRFVLQDSAEQSPKTRELLASLSPREPGYVSLLVLCEFAWVLTRSYRRPRSAVAQAVAGLLNTPVLRMERAHVLGLALEQYVSSSADFGDCCIAAVAADVGCDYTITFDKDAAKLPGMRMLS